MGPCADHHEEVAAGYKAVFIDTSPSHLPPKLWHKKSLPFLEKFQLLCKWYISVEYYLRFAFGKKKKSLALACVCFIVRPFEALVCECLCQCVWLRMGALCAKEARLFLAGSLNPAASHRAGCLNPHQGSLGLYLSPVLRKPLPFRAGL